MSIHKRFPDLNPLPFFLTFLLLLTASNALGNFKGTLYEMGSNRKTIVMNYEHRESKGVDGGLISTQNIYRDLSGQDVYLESSLFENGALKSLRVEHKNKKEEGQLTIENGVLQFQYTRDGKTKSSSESLDEQFATGPTLVAFIQKNWKKLLSGDEVKMRLAVLDRLETVGFKLFLFEKKQSPAGQLIVIKMKPSSIVISALVSPLFLTLPADGSKLLELKGRVPPKVYSKGKFRDLDAEVVYHH